MDVKTQNFLILGVSKSGYNAGKFVLEKGGKCFLYEEHSSEKIQNAIIELQNMGAILVGVPLQDEVLRQIDVVVISPGVPINHEVAVRAKQAGKRIIGELEFAFMQKMPRIIAVTGTNGKTTTVNLINAIFAKSNEKSLLVGNVGIPVSSKIKEIDEETVCITEVSSFQLEGVKNLTPHVACILNVSPDHLERHFDMETYVYLKKRLLKNQRESEYSVLNYDDLTVRNMFQETAGKVVWVSREQEVTGAYENQGKIYYNGEYIMETDELNLKGEHNVFNSLFAIACAKILKLDNGSIISALKEFKGVSHRIELIAEKNGVRYYDDSKATNTASTITAIKSMNRPTVLILGGSEKGEEYDELFRQIKQSNVIHTVLTGASRFNMLDCASKLGLAEFTVTKDFEHAVRIASMMAKDGDCVLLSPSCASFDSFSNYQERGDSFKKIVEDV